jgi:NAD(P)-dependent dehydrogenase (short-subunit alcohol dehydrogenase family)
VPREQTVDGYERQLATNHLGAFALTGRLLPALLRRPGARVVAVSSAVAQSGRIRLDDLQREQGYRRWGAYAQSKLADLLFAFELDRRATATGTTLVSVAAHPGFAATNLQAATARRQGHRWRAAVVAFGSQVFGQPAAALWEASERLTGVTFAWPRPVRGAGRPRVEGGPARCASG